MMIINKLLYSINFLICSFHQLLMNSNHSFMIIINPQFLQKHMIINIVSYFKKDQIKSKLFKSNKSLLMPYLTYKKKSINSNLKSLQI